METGQEVLSLKITRAGDIMAYGELGSLAFSPDGKNLALGTTQGQVWEAELPSPDVLVDRHAQILLSFLSRRFLADDMLEHLERERKLSEPLRREALAQVERRDRETRLALAQAERLNEGPEMLNGLSWSAVFRGGRKKETYRLALRCAQEACRLDPENGNYLNTLGVAQYRMEQYREALETLTRSYTINSAKQRGAYPSDLGFLAMTHYRLGQQEKAQAFLGLLREALKKPEWSGDPDAQDVLRVAEELIEPKAAETKR